MFEYVNDAVTAMDSKLDWTNAAFWATYDHKTEIPGWKAYILNPRVSYEAVDDFIQTLDLMKTFK